MQMHDRVSLSMAFSWSPWTDCSLPFGSTPCHSTPLPSVLFHSIPFHLLHSILFHSWHESAPFHSISWFRPCSNWTGAVWLDKSFNLCKGMYLPTTHVITVRTWTIYPVTSISSRTLHVASLLIPINSWDVHTWASSLCRWGNWHTQWLSAMYSVTRLIGRRCGIWSQELEFQPFLWYKKQKASSCCLQDFPGEPLQREKVH